MQLSERQVCLTSEQQLNHPSHEKINTSMGIITSLLIHF
jgi:hypothetical protein